MISQSEKVSFRVKPTIWYRLVRCPTHILRLSIICWYLVGSLKCLVLRHIHSWRHSSLSLDNRRIFPIWSYPFRLVTLIIIQNRHWFCKLRGWDLSFIDSTMSLIYFTLLLVFKHITNILMLSCWKLFGYLHLFFRIWTCYRTHLSWNFGTCICMKTILIDRLLADIKMRSTWFYIFWSKFGSIDIFGKIRLRHAKVLIF